MPGGDPRQLGGPCDSRLGPFLHDRGGDATRPSFLAVRFDQIRQLEHVQIVDQVGGGQALGAVHAHVQRAVRLEAESSFRIQELKS